MTFQEVQSHLHDFYVLAGTASATLVGLLFVGLSLHLRTVVTVPEVRALARVTLANFGAVLFVTLFMVIVSGPETAATELISSGIVSLVVTVPSLRAAVRTGGSSLEMRRGDRVRLALRFGLSIGAYAAVVASGLLLLDGLNAAYVDVIVTAIVVLLLVSLRNTWDLLVTVGEITVGDQPGGR